ncbi:FecR family protein [Pseudobacter ginsenosidimutans]|uniref:FecR family protein n=1 Tax=Pseudobacter ginsenosidimutans TaxID=661488 RepID=A0A4Q7N2N2_9BACT|nr:FecR family protein [Pseudobacter ginsenosidimutans]QEC42965.1 DUF4974 domain-containing protein [Pseudobacter ginsenosidimutans]RZS74315.1 FecR family protein [Pseudobacter ginsenosidimutans]
MTKIEIISLLQKHANDEAFTPEEELLFAALEKDKPGMAEAIIEMLTVDERSSPYDETIWEPILSSVLSMDKIPSEAPVINRSSSARRVPFLRKWYWVAACLIGVLTVISYFWIISEKRNAATLPELVQKDIQPGKDGAVLTLADGSRVLLDTIQNGTVALQEGVTAKVVNGSLAYEGKGSNRVYNTMSTPKGRQYKLTLPDGSEVWLNAASSIRYPTIFNDKERKVELEGEAYFEVKKNAKQPFIVNARNKAEIEVLGTSFNVSAYENEKSLNTTLIEGSVKVNGAIIKPGQQARVTDMVRIINIEDTDKIMAWQRGFFNFDNASFEEVMRQLERWYDISVEYEKGIPSVEFGGEMSMNTSLNGILLALEKSRIQYKLEGNILTVLSK